MYSLLPWVQIMFIVLSPDGRLEWCICSIALSELYTSSRLSTQGSPTHRFARFGNPRLFTICPSGKRRLRYCQISEATSYQCSLLNGPFPHRFLTAAEHLVMPA